jgi:two-component system sporulation sensor kinase A
LGNAYDAFKEFRGRIEVDAEKDNIGNIIVQVKDYGIGMDDEQLKRLFEPFYTTKAKGTGLGLTVCKQIVTLHNGSIEVRSLKEKGTTVTVTLPLRSRSAAKNLNS